MKPNSIEFIYSAMNALASGTHDPETEQILADVIEEELLAIQAGLVLTSSRANTEYAAHAEARVA
jgi:hypothetical protein